MIDTKKASGLGVSFGIGIGQTMIIEKEKIIIPRYKIDDIKKESNRFFSALEKIKSETKALYDNKSFSDNITKAEILNAYITIIEDSKVISEVIRLIEEKHFNAESAVNDGLDIIVKCFETMECDYLKERAVDIIDIKNRLLMELLNLKNNDINNLKENTILVCEELSISDSMKIDFSKVSGIIAQKGGKDSHASIIARSLEIPSVFNVENIFSLVKNGDTVALNGTTGEIFINPNIEKINEYKVANLKYLISRTFLQTFRDKPCITSDGTQLSLYANISCPAETQKAIENYADGIGLFRSEFIYVNRDMPPSEDEQFHIYKSLAKDMSNRSINIRTIDIGGDKSVPYIKYRKEENPALGCRGIRICLNKTELFKTQLRAILRASIYGNINILFPMITSMHELQLAKNILENVKDDLRNDKVQFNEKIKIGIMIETPSAAIMSDILAKKCDFFSIGTNDLIQYTAATDRTNPLVADLYSQYHPSVLRLIYKTVTSAKDMGIPCTLCGETASNSLLLPVLIGLGLTSFSVNPNFLLKSKKEFSNINYNLSHDLALKVLGLDDEIAVKETLIQFKLNYK